jgi:hypothetical protein
MDTGSRFLFFHDFAIALLWQGERHIEIGLD